MKVFKFGGASVKDAAGVKNLAKIVNSYNDSLVVVISAMGKMTNAFEELVYAYFNGNGIEQHYQKIKEYHLSIITDLFEPEEQGVIDEWLEALQLKLDTEPSLNYDFEYDQIVPFGELISTFIVSSYLNKLGWQNEWIDVRKILRTDDLFRSAGVNWELSSELMKEAFSFEGTQRYITQGFIGSTDTNLTTTLGREGSDYTGAIIAYALDAESLSIWKDVPGVLNADPRWYPKARMIDELSYWEAIELTYYGAQVIHPKTIKPLQNKQIPLLVKSFIEPENKGTAIKDTEQNVQLPPIYVLKEKQTLLSISPKDFSFILEENLSEIFQVISKHRLKINLMQSSALNFSVCVDHHKNIDAVMDELSEHYGVLYNVDMELVTIRHYTDKAISEVIDGKEVVDSQVSRKTARYVVKQSEWNFK
ncbi:aspartate kinase [Carboxylicivirga linearis]|uniref:Aspartokinase n=1 Tax=Carboxylicivirga linearis TaxID=1628157 RepID=A0ABS5JZK3_9BACT|nr:aspartate kinase [Carboxylicivirga linearis]MBS2100334.1 aspartate kinase [Carboxylicivirga linearis]